MSLRIDDKSKFITERMINMRLVDRMEEVQTGLNNNMGCIIFDLSCYFPYIEQDKLTIDFSIGLEKCDDIKLNHRYPNKSYITVSKKNGKKLSKMGYPYFCELGKPIPMLLKINIGFTDEEDTITYIFPVEVELTKEKPVCYLTFRQNFETSFIQLFTTYHCEGGGWRTITWTNDEKEDNYKGMKTIFLQPPSMIDDGIFVYQDVITPIAQKVDELLIW